MCMCVHVGDYVSIRARTLGNDVYVNNYIVLHWLKANIVLVTELHSKYNTNQKTMFIILIYL